MDPAGEQPTTSSAAAAPPSASPTPRAKRPVSRASIDSANSYSKSHQEYLDSLVPPTKEEFAHIAEIQAEREAELKRRQREQQRQSIDAVARPETASSQPPQPAQHAFSRFGFGRRTSGNDDGLRAKAATVIQRTYRGYRARRELKGLGIDASTRWVHAVREAQWREMTTPRARTGLGSDGAASPGRPGSLIGPVSRTSTARQNWKKVSTIARHAGGDVDADSSSISSSSSSSSSDSESGDSKRSDEQKKLERKRKEEAKARRKQEAKMMGLQYFLEMVDLKHRYGANLRVYHEEWKRADTNENFFYWLDYGEGRNLDLEMCPRERLDREQVRYLSREERQYYLVNVDDEGRLCWAKNGARIDTSEKWKDSIHGIVPSDDPTPAYAPLSENQTTLLGDTTTDSDFSSRPSSSSSSSSSHSTAHHSHHSHHAPSITSTTTTAAGARKKASHHLPSATTILNKLLRKSVRKNTWIFVADTSFRLYVGIKNSGAFQHSSFLQGSRISAAGLIRIKDGRLTSLSPLSGHYRPPASNFRAFVKSLKEAGVDMGRVSVSKSYAVLVGVEMYVKVKKRAGEVVGKVKGKGHHRQASGSGGEGRGKVVVPPVVVEEEEEEGRAEGRPTEGELVTGRGAVVENEDGQRAPAAGSRVPEEPHAQQQKEEEKMREDNSIAVEVLQKLNLGRGLTEPPGQKGDGDREGEDAAAPASHLT
ncbi:hypothetical protein VTI74DRAFT_4887 [Chaetomium olivicolor]